MKKTLLILTLVFLEVCHFSAQAQVLITNFTASGAGQYVSTFYDFDSVEMNPATDTYQFIGNNSESAYGTIVPSVDLSGLTSLSLLLTGTFSGTANGFFQIELFDADGDSQTFQASWASFNPSVETTISMLPQFETGTFDPSSVVSMGLLGGGLASESIDFTAKNLIAVPECSIFGFLGLSALLGILYCGYSARWLRLRAFFKKGLNHC